MTADAQQARRLIQQLIVCLIAFLVTLLALMIATESTSTHNLLMSSVARRQQLGNELVPLAKRSRDYFRVMDRDGSGALEREEFFYAITAMANLTGKVHILSLTHTQQNPKP